jgi:hypothetical protein
MVDHLLNGLERTVLLAGSGDEKAAERLAWVRILELCVCIETPAFTMPPFEACTINAV